MEIKDRRIDAGKPFDWGRSSKEYARFRDIYPEGFYRKIVDRKLCISGQCIVKNDDPELLAVELTAPAVQQIARSDRQPQYEEECMEYIEKHLRHFCKVCHNVCSVL